MVQAMDLDQVTTASMVDSPDQVTTASVADNPDPDSEDTKEAKEEIILTEAEF